MKILFLPNNIASMTAITVRAINKTGEHQARGLILGDNSSFKHEHAGLRIIRPPKRGIKRYLLFAKWYSYFLRNLFWCDIVHWSGSFNNQLLQLTLPIIKLLGKPGLIEFVGGERNPEVEFLDNKFYKEIYYAGYEYPYETAKNNEQIQNLFSKAGFSALALPNYLQHFSPIYFKNIYSGFQRIDVSTFNPVFPDVNNEIPLIIHSPSAPIAKGTKYVLRAIEKLKEKYDFEFRLVQNMPHSKAMELVKSSDIFIDQLMLGGYGMAAMEAMAFGKPVICYMKDSVLKNELPADIPIINANPETIFMVIEKVLTDGALRRNQIGKLSREYVTKYHDIENEIPKLVDIYELIKKGN